MYQPERSQQITRVVVLQPTPFCNINCRYCYLPQRALARTMTSAVLVRILDSLFTSSLLAESITLLWHAGEPLVAPLSFYQEAFRHIERLNTKKIRIISLLQTNGTLITQQWCDFIKLQGIRVSVSLDGPQHIHDRYRVDRAGKGSFARAMRGVQLLQQNGIEPFIIMVLTRYALDYPDEIWQFFCEHGLNQLAFNIEEVNGIHTHSSLESEENVLRYKHFLQRICELRAQSERPPYIREINTFLERIQLLSEPTLSEENIAGVMLNFDYAGNVSTFASDLLTMQHPRFGDFKLGNVFTERLEDMLNSPKLHALNAEVQRGVANCQQSCQYFDFCGGGSPVNKLSEHGQLDATETMHCRLNIQTAMDVALQHLELRHNRARDNNQ
ncbi:GRRM system radical SAM/SPASM domain protein [Ktedonosporobacter rubrisoli]|uniref:GRRM system radical SAM/SPASM domain protein n=1 Tax=Ktedonosporobacter rubrisoli TaxID=2509675 RepID=A0A4P6JTC0_KTERU|nr:cyclophane-forming radical SAM/SPASM peptide maturase GrrM/OscB [Ktedonosporobacter rubrisoli]QBD78565.1 GRRM system radical SAM/SPASM domain protein [Ktedonosporobacter rubrisoli]